MTKKKPYKDPHQERESRNYDRPIASRELILELLQEQESPINREQIRVLLQLEDEEQQEALRRRLRAMERDGQLVFTRAQCYALPERMGVVTGKVIGHRDGHGFVKLDEGGSDMFLPPRQMLSVMHGDSVLVLPVREDRKGRKEARIVRVLDETPRSIVGRFFVEKGNCFVVPDDNRLNQDIVIPKENTMGARQGNVVVIDLIQRPNARQNALGKITEILGEHMAPGMEIKTAIRRHEIPHKWPNAVTKSVKHIPELVPEKDKEGNGRVDLRHLPLVTIDGEDARDFDDAVYCETKPSGGWRLWVAIADVSYYVRPGTALDDEAVERATSVYFPQQVIPMLPEELSNGLCSLNPEVDRLCMVCEMTVSAKGALSGYKFYPAVMESKARLTYNKVAAILDGDSTLIERYKPLVGHLQQLHNLYDALNVARIERGALGLETLETRFIFNAFRKIDNIVPVTRNVAHKIIEECMILANVSAAKYVEKHKAEALFRVHDTPGEERLVTFRNFLSELGLHLGGAMDPSPKDYSDVLKRTADRPDAELIQTMLLRSMRQAVYDAENIGHFGLALKSYAHFTSPIRRYPDLLLHRTIKYLIAKEHGEVPDRWTPIGGYHYFAEDMDYFGPHCSKAERRADEATRDVDSWLKCEYMQDHVGDEFEGVIASVTSFGFFVRLNELHVDGLVHISNLQNDYYQFDGARQRLVGNASGKTYRIGDPVEVKVAAVNLDDKMIDFMLAGQMKGTGKPRRGKSNSSKSGKASKGKKSSSANAKSGVWKDTGISKPKAGSARAAVSAAGAELASKKKKPKFKGKKKSAAGGKKKVKK
ncbi:ribonuclease R [Echinimonas agarilytica]|uniref:Ribonuclease R n=1 Tax=Echinimonas agarilytica TaxID=1215918 RepID=A0AA42B6F0_9GAMM|nr:ribonuclease R [Echinimonas agarilytica]